MVTVLCERCGGKLAKWDSIGLDWVMFCINCGSEFYTREAELKEQWQALFGKEPPPFNRPYLQSRLAYRIQELAYGGLRRETLERLEALGEQIDGRNITLRRIRHEQRPIAGTRLIREYQGVEHIVTVTRDGYEWQGRPYRSLSAIARAITGTRWNGWVFFGLKNHRSRA